MKKTSQEEHERRWAMIQNIGVKATAKELGVQVQTLRATTKKFKNWVPVLPFQDEQATIVSRTTPALIQVESEVRELIAQASSEPTVEVLGQIETVTTGDIVRYTNEDDDSRFYWHKTKVNSRTGNHFFPSFSFIMGLGAPSNPNLVEWYKNQGHNADKVFKQREKEGSFVHDCCDRMVSKGHEIPMDEIDKVFGDSAKRVKDSLLGFINFWTEQQPQVISNESPIVGEDFAGTQDLRCRIKEDDYKKTWKIDLKTSKAIYDHHRLQLVAYNVIEPDEELAILQLGSQTQKKYTLSKVTKKDKEEMLLEWNAIKELAYVKIKRENWIEPRPCIYPPVFKLPS